MKSFDTAIIGGGPAGLKCALELSRSDLSVLLLEKDKGFGDKVCAGGLTIKDLQLLDLPQKLLQQTIQHASIHSRKRSSHTHTHTAFLFTINRLDLGQYQRNLLEGTQVEVRTECQVTGIDHGEIILKDGQSISYKYLVGADGYSSIVRRHLKLKVKKRLIGYQYYIPHNAVKPELAVFMDARRFGAWYAWSFPHSTSIAVGCCCDPGQIDHLNVRDNFMVWLREKEIDPGSAKLLSYPIGCDYQGYHFDNIFLAGEAAGLASWFTGEGIYQSLVSGQEIARKIMDPRYDTAMLNQVLKYNRALERILRLLLFAGPLKGLLQEFMLYLISRKRIREKIKAGFS